MRRDGVKKGKGGNEGKGCKKGMEGKEGKGGKRGEGTQEWYRRQAREARELKTHVSNCKTCMS